jgi:hypothetical protein
MDYKGTWESIGKTFYTTNFSLLVTALIVWDGGFFRVAPETLSCIFELKSFDNWLFMIFSLFSLLGLLGYFILDWLDANIITSIDSNVKKKDIVLWLVAPILISTTIAILVRKGQDYSIWLYGGFVFYLLYSGLILLFRDTRIERKVATNHFKEQDSNKYDKIQLLKYLHYLVGAIFVIVGVVLIFNYLNNKTEIESIVLLGQTYLFIFGMFLLTILINILLKYYRHKLVHIPIYEYNKKIDVQNQNN